MLTIPSRWWTFHFCPGGGVLGQHTALLGFRACSGLVVDDAIVWVEAIEARSSRDDLRKMRARIDGRSWRSAVGIALGASRAVFIFRGGFFMAGSPASVYRQFALTMQFSVLLSAVNALTLSRPPRRNCCCVQRHADHPVPLARFSHCSTSGFAAGGKTATTRTCDLLIRRLRWVSSTRGLYGACLRHCETGRSAIIPALRRPGLF